ncbi:MAG: tyrosine--tRNA ligase [Clostridia bacterium]|nr:tyrosine--tRNA ligase [Clostridia bacterium]
MTAEDDGAREEAESVAGDELDRQVRLLTRGAATVVSEQELRQKLARSARLGRPLRVKLGLDPTSPDVHLGHTVVLRRLRQFQDLGHEVVVIVGDFTARIGDPSGRSETRKPLDEATIEANARTYAEQVFRVLDPARTRVVRNSTWLAPLDLAAVIRLSGLTTVARVLERDDFARRLRENQPIGLHELLYPLLQGYDSVALEADVELGGSDQTFNLMMAREIQRALGQEPEVALTMPILEGLDGVQKMSKSLGNYVGLTEPPDEMYGKLMSIPDRLVGRYLLLCTDVPQAQVESMERSMAAGHLNPRDAKALLAREVVRLYHGEEAARAAEERFLAVFRKHELPERVPEVELPPDLLLQGGSDVPHLLLAAGLVASSSEGRRLVLQGGVRVDGRRVEDPEARLEVRDGLLLQVGRRRFARLRLPGGGTRGEAGT